MTAPTYVKRSVVAHWLSSLAHHGRWPSEPFELNRSRVLSAYAAR
jgi:hypothetical protein